jgi:LmbE family N-acetylglucosaminyl deacetylase
VALNQKQIKAAVIVAHPDDETLWAGGMVLSHPEYQWFIVCLCRKSDPDRSPKFYRVLNAMGVEGSMADLDDGPEQAPLSIAAIQEEVLRLLPQEPFDLVLTHAPAGEYTRHRRHEEVSEAVIGLWRQGKLATRRLGLFAYEDAHKQRLPQAIPEAHLVQPLTARLHGEKKRLITELYGFEASSWEARTTPQTEAFWFFDSPSALEAWIKENEEH